MSTATASDSTRDELRRLITPQADAIGGPVTALRILQQHGDLVSVQSRKGEITLPATVTERVAPGVVYTTFHHPDTGANVVTTELSDWATDCPEYKVTAVEVRPANHRSEWQDRFTSRAAEQAALAPGGR